MPHLLIVEDHEENRNLLKMLLAANGYRVTAAGNGLEALAAARRDPPDAIVSDVLMPNMDGFALCRAWMQDATLKPIPFIFYSATYVRPDDERFAMALGAVRYLIKPLEAEVFLAELRAVLQQWTGRPAPLPVVPLDDAAAHVLHESALARKLEDKIAQLEAAKRKLEESEARFRSLTAMSSDFYWESDATHRLTQRASAVKKLSTVSVFERGAQIGDRRWDIPHLSPDAAGWAAHRAVLVAHLPFREFELSRLGTDGNERFISISGDPVFDVSGAFTGYRGVGTDVTERKKSEEGLKLFRALVDQSNDAIEVIDPNTFRFLDVNQKGCLDLGYSREEMLSLTVFDIDSTFDRSTSMEMVQGLRKLGAIIIEGRHRRKDGSEFPVEVSIKYIRLDRDYVFSIARDITERERVEQEMRESEERLRAMFEGALDGILVADIETRKFLTGNPEICRMLGYSLEEIVHMSIPDILLPHAIEQFERLISGEITLNAGVTVMRKDGSLFYADIKAAHIRFGGKDTILGIFRDITERKRAEQQLADSEQRFRGLVEQAVTGIYIIQDGKFAYVNPRVAQILGYDSADQLIGREALSLVAEQDRSMVAQNLREQIKSKTLGREWEFSAQRRDGTVAVVGVHSTLATHHGRPAAIGLIQDISEKKRAEEQIQHYVTQLENAFMSTVQVATTLGEMRDPYTAGHQRRVAEIAVAIGAELGFDARRQEGLRVAGYLHDIGKIRIPSEILSKPGKLNPTEFQLVQGHAQASYDVLKDVEFPWPVAEVALQHHERMDGSGYPQGLKGEAILFEARIMAVADVIEAMSSHRPYRPGLGIDKALAEIERGSGSAYDREVADACRRLFRERRYQLPA